ncbi:Crp/Fnr family transcriptional regulator [Bittarella massiliensis (ex Durand et al. 2017)]|uniref:Crp/Fnr family transcriptional regulator n=1 Tax=Bittarella massiliensis (ex Durand et al. 2017) TaxID=1720313 RepID=UPI001AA1B4B2|nr:Crp/Fnr family transcriptional regulator [Bittarella massiliensis (ex Durand et al. 2017)]MBO1680435.1 Crp/Fnr family transcriptional regulator [Bittarella massiliensis (ex Durand et al. 2017)]
MKGLIDFLEAAPAAVRRQLEEVSFARRAPILWEGMENSAVYILLEGDAEGYLQGVRGQVSPVFHYCAPSLFGEFEVFCGRENVINVAAVSPCRLYRLSRGAFLEWMRADFDFTQYVVAQLVRKLTENTVLFDKFGRYTVKERVLRTVAAWHRAGRLPQLTKEVLTVEAGAPLRSVNRAVATCAGEGIFCWEKRRFRVLDEAALSGFLPQ